MPCLSCLRGFLCGNCSPVDDSVENAEDEEVDDDGTSIRDGRRSKRRVGKRDAYLKDQQSTGRKRAAVAYPLNFDSVCEWAALKYAGGGTHPIIGCLENKQQARHHGPDKNTLNNELGNVHRICHEDHNRWHTLNDPDYVWGSVYTPHDPNTKATLREIIANAVFWKGKKIKKVVD